MSQLTPISSFGGDIVRIEAGPGGVFGNDIYAISRGGGENLTDSTDPTGAQALDNNTTPPVVSGAINRPGVIYRVNPATGQTNVFFDLNTVIPQLDANKSTTAANSLGASTGMVNWYDIAFDPEGEFNGTPSMFVTSVDSQDPAKNAIYQISPSGQFLGMFVDFSAGFSEDKLNVNPSAVVVPPPQDQAFLRGLISGGGISTTNSTTFAALLFNANAYTPGANISSGALPVGVSQTDLTEGPITGLTASNPDYLSAVYSTFADFGTPAAGGIPAQEGNSGVQGIEGELLISGGGIFKATFGADNAITITGPTGPIPAARNRPSTTTRPPTPRSPTTFRSFRPAFAGWRTSRSTSTATSPRGRTSWSLATGTTLHRYRPEQSQEARVSGSIARHCPGRRVHLAERRGVRRPSGVLLQHCPQHSRPAAGHHSSAGQRGEPVRR